MADGEDDGGAALAEATPALMAEVQEIAARAVTSETTSNSTPIESLDPMTREDLANKQNNRRLRLIYAIVVLAILAAQLAVADIIFYWYASIGMKWKVPVPAISAWLGAVVIQVIGVALVITRGLFPNPQGGSDSK